MIIDAYAHCGREKYLPQERLETAHREAGVGGCLLVQHMGQFDNGYLAQIVASAPDRYKAIGLIDAERTDGAAALDGLLCGATHGVSFSGVRMTDAMLDAAPACLDLLNAYAATLCVHFPGGVDQQLPRLQRIAAEYPNVTIYVPHLGWPKIVDGRASRSWTRALERLATIGQTIVGLSAVDHFSRQPYPHRDIWPSIRQIVGIVGADRAVWASDFPLVLKHETVSEYVRIFREPDLGLNDAEQRALLGETAIRVWRFGK